MPTLQPANENRVFLVFVDETPELRVALHFACLRAKHHGGRVALLYVISPTDSQQWLAIEDLMRIERREQAEATLADLTAEVVEWSGQPPIIHLREGVPSEELTSLVDEDPSISIVVLGVGAGPEGPGPLVSAMTGKFLGRLRVPVTLVPGSLSDVQLAELT